VLRALGNVLATGVGIVVVLALVFAIFLAVVTRSEGSGVITVFGQRPFIVLSGSMSPTFDAGDLIVDRRLTLNEAGRLHKGEVITFVEGRGNAGATTVITHRIYKVSRRLDAKTQSYTTIYETKGDANPQPDRDAIPPQQVLGVYEYRIPDAGYVLNALHQPLAFILLVSAPFVFLVLVEGTRRWKKAGERDPSRRT
jgi:signal peptidase